jgi:hypothetical protein
VNFTIPATSKRIITIVVSTMAIAAVETITTLSIILIKGAKPDPTLLTAYIGIAAASLTGLTALLANTRSSPGTDADMPKATVTQTTTTAEVQTTDKPTP